MNEEVAYCPISFFILQASFRLLHLKKGGRVFQTGPPFGFLSRPFWRAART